MKKLITILTIAAITSSFVLNTGIGEIISALKAGNAAQMAKYFDASVEITMPDKSNSYSKSQAELVLKEFFDNNGVRGFEVIHQGENAGSQYCIGTLQTKNGSYRTTIFMKQKKDAQVLQEIRFENR